MSSRHKAYLYLLIVAVIWGLASPIIKFGFEYLSPLIFLTYRFMISAFVMIPLLLAIEPDTLPALGRLKSGDWLYLLIGGFLGSTVQLGLLFWGLSLTTSLDGSIINAASPIFVALAGYFFLKEEITTWEKLGLLIAFLGSVIIVIQPVLEGQSFFAGAFAGNFLVFLGTLAWVGYVLFTKRQLNHKLSPLLLTTNMFVIGFLSLLPFSIFRLLPSIINLPLTGHLSVLYMSLLSGTVAYWLYQKAQKLIEASEANVIPYLAPVFTFPAAHYWLGEPITPFLIVGALIIVVGVFICEFTRR